MLQMTIVVSVVTLVSLIESVSLEDVASKLIPIKIYHGATILTVSKDGEWSYLQCHVKYM